MSTRCTIAYKRNDGKYVAIFCHWDGGLWGVGAILSKEYNDYDKVKAMISLGNLDSLACLIYACRDMKQEWEIEKPCEFETVDAMLHGRNTEDRVYLFEDGKWLYKKFRYGNLEKWIGVDRWTSWLNLETVVKRYLRNRERHLGSVV